MTIIRSVYQGFKHLIIWRILNKFSLFLCINEVALYNSDNLITIHQKRDNNSPIPDVVQIRENTSDKMIENVTILTIRVFSITTYTLYTTRTCRMIKIEYHYFVVYN